MTTTTTPDKQGIGSRFLSFARTDAHVTRLVVILLALLVLFAAVRPSNFANSYTWISMAVSFPEFGLMALGVMVCMVTGGIDLSVVGIANLSAIIAAMVMLALAPGGAGTAVGVSIVVALVVGAVAGVVNGILVAVVKIPAILATLGTLELFIGISIVLTAGSPISGLPTEYSTIMAARFGGVLPMQFVVFLVAVALVALVMGRTTFGTKIYMLGTNATSAKFSGLNSTSLLIRTYLFSGVLSAMAGLVMLANYNSAKADYGLVYTLLTVLIVVLGGVNPNGGSGRLIGVVLAIVILQILSSGLNLFPGISNFYRDLIWGGVLLLVIATSELRTGNLFKRKKKEVS